MHLVVEVDRLLLDDVRSWVGEVLRLGERGRAWVESEGLWGRDVGVHHWLTVLLLLLYVQRMLWWRNRNLLNLLHLRHLLYKKHRLLSILHRCDVLRKRRWDHHKWHRHRVPCWCRCNVLYWCLDGGGGVVLLVGWLRWGGCWCGCGCGLGREGSACGDAGA